MDASPSAAQGIVDGQEAFGDRPDAIVDRREAVEAYRNNRARTQALFDLLTPDAYYAHPIPLRHPVVFYDGHIPAFAVNALLKRGLGHPGIDNDLETLFARGIDPAGRSEAARSARDAWPSRDTVAQYVAKADDAILSALASGPIEGTANGVVRRGQGVFTILEHEAMHQETLLYMWHWLDGSQKRCPSGYEPAGLDAPAPPPEEMVVVPAGRTTLGARIEDIPFGWDNEFPACAVEVPAFAIDAHDVTNACFLEFVEAGGYQTQSLWPEAAWARQRASGRTHPRFWEQAGGEWRWRGMFHRVPLPPAWPVWVTHDEAAAYARWRGLRLPTEAEFHRAAYGTPAGTERTHPWGEAPPDATHGNFDFGRWDPAPVGSHPAGASAWGIHDLVGNGWEWTSTVFGGFPGFEAMASYPEYSADFFDGDHFVVKGASPATPAGLVRRSFRNWFRPYYPYMYAAFRCARDAA